MNEKVCSRCKKILNYSEFSCTKKNPDGSCRYRNSWCKECKKKTEEKRRREAGISKKIFADILEDSKLCLQCHKYLPFSHFSPTSRGSAGVSSYCKKCFAEKYRDTEKAKERTSRYRERHSAKWKSLHRMHQFKRRYNIVATSDGTVTEDFLKALYLREHCFWCGKFTPVKLRTLEHVIELGRGGTHSVTNIEMACKSCNSSRKNRNGKYD